MTETGGDRDRLRLAIIDVRERPAGTVELVLSARLASKKNRIRGIAWRLVSHEVRAGAPALDPCVDDQCAIAARRHRPPEAVVSEPVALAT
jgi:hypothetical protein